MKCENGDHEFELVEDCHRCGAPVCCAVCCKEAMTQITDDEFTGEAILIAGLEAELEKQDRVINALDQQLCEARAEIERLQATVKELKQVAVLAMKAVDEAGQKMAPALDYLDWHLANEMSDELWDELAPQVFTEATND